MDSEKFLKFHSIKTDYDYCLHLSETEIDMILYCLENSSARDFVELYEKLKALRSGVGFKAEPFKSLILNASIKCPHCHEGISLSLQKDNI